MKPISFDAFSFDDLQNLNQMFLLLERSGVDVRSPRVQLETYIHKGRADVRRNKNKPPPEIAPRKQPAKRTERVMQSGIACPACHKAYLQVKLREGVTYTACPSCTKSVEFK